LILSQGPPSRPIGHIDPQRRTQQTGNHTASFQTNHKFAKLSVPKLRQRIRTYCWIFAIAFLFVRVLCDGFKARRRLEAEILVLRHQLNVLQQRAPHRLYLTWADRALFVWLYRGFPRILDAITILRPQTIVRWHRKGFSAFWRWKSRPLGGRPQIDKEVRPYPKNELREPTLGCAAYPR
jgi:hypothetical protein